MKGYVQVYTENGKWKTTASLGLAFRASGAGLKVFVMQFLKKGEFSDIKSLAALENITLEQYGLDNFIRGNPSDEDKAAGARPYERLCQILTNNQHDLVIVEGGHVAVTCQVISEADLLALIDMKPPNVELVITGRGALASVIDRADLVTEVNEIKHYDNPDAGVRKGIEK